MKLTYEQIKNITLGAAYVENVNGKTVFHRFTREQESLYKSVLEKFYNKTFANSCITLEFKTNSSSLFIKTELTPRTSRYFYSHDVYVDNLLCGCIKGELDDTDNEIKKKTVEGKFSLGKENEEKTVRIHLPWSCSSDIFELSIDDGATIVPIEKSCKIIFFGDSITHGYDAEYTSNSYASRIALSLNAEARNKGIGGEMFRAELAKIKDDGFEPNIITVAYGTNDWFLNVSRPDFCNETDGFFSALINNYPKAKIFAIAPIWRTDFQDEHPIGKFSDVRDILLKLSEKYPRINVIDGFDFVPHDCELFSDRSLHPNDEGFSYYANSLEERIKKYL